MAIGICSDEDFEKELNDLTGSDKNQVSVIDLPSRGRGQGNNEVPEGLRKIIGEESIESGRTSALDLARNFGISDSSVSAYSVGATSTNRYNKPEFKNHINKVKEKIGKKARGKLLAALEEITPEKLASAKLRDVSGVARDMSVIIQNMEPAEEKSSDQAGTQFIIYAPQFRQESSFDVIEVSE